jgi:hypothetical protein
MQTFNTWAEKEKARHRIAAKLHARSLLKCLEDGILSQDAGIIGRLIKEIDEHCRLGGLQ